MVVIFRAFHIYIWIAFIGFNSNRRFYRWTNDIAEYLEDMADRERQTEVGTVAELLDEIEAKISIKY